MKFTCIFALTSILAAASAEAMEPRVPPGMSAGGVGVALLGPGIDYTSEELKGRLARDGEGELISYDFTDGDSRPFAAAGGTGTTDASMVARLAPKSELIIVKEQRGSPQSFGHMMNFVARTPARIVVWADADPKRLDWPILEQAIRRFRDRLFIIPAGEGGIDLDWSPTFKGIRGLDNVIIVGRGGAETTSNRGKLTVTVSVEAENGGEPANTREAALMIAALAARAMAADPARSMTDLKRAIAPTPTVSAMTAKTAFTAK